MSRLTSALVFIAAVILVGAGAYYLYFADPLPDAPPPPPPLTQQGGAAPATAPVIEHPIEAAPAALPALQASDGVLTTALTQLFGGAAVRQMFNVDDGVRRIVATVDALPRETLPQQRLPLQAVPGEFRVQKGADGVRTDPRNSERYAAYVKLIDEMDARQAARLYVQLYPLFQQAYEELGYPRGYFNDRLVASIDHLLDAPEPKVPMALVQPKVRYQYADASLESMSAGHKAMLRLSAAQQQRVKAKLRELRGEIARSPTR